MKVTANHVQSNSKICHDLLLFAVVFLSSRASLELLREMHSDSHLYLDKGQRRNSETVGRVHGV